jgi:predicted heme/steroid binding protein
MLGSNKKKTQVIWNAITYERQDITLEQLSKYDGKNGNPAYVAIDGIVYDVTNNAAWAAATHFGLSAGKDLTRPFNSCHGASQILSKLKIVGKLI